MLDNGALASLREGRLHDAPSTRPSEVFFDCGEDFSSITGRWHFNCRPSASIVRRNVLVAGWLEMRGDETTAPWVNRASDGIEDVFFFDIVLDARFLHRLYGKGGLSNGRVRAEWNAFRQAAEP